MRILFYNHTGQVSGAERLLLMILARLDRNNFYPVVICPAPGPLPRMVIDLAVPVETLAGLDARFTWRPDHLVRYLKSFLQVIRQLRRRVISSKPDLIHANSIRAGLVATAATFGLRTRVVWHLHDMLPRHPFSMVIRAFAFLSARTRMIAVSEAVADNFCGVFFPLRRRTSVILNAIDLEKFQPNQSATQGIRGELQLHEAKPLIGIVGQLTPRKGQLELLRSFAAALKEIPRAMLLIVGAPLFNRDHEYLELLKQTALELGIAGQVRMPGARSDIAAIMPALDLLVINSSTEPFGLVALESMACGTPVLAAASGGIPEIIEHGKNGWLVPVGEAEALTAAIVALGREPELRARLAQQGRNDVAARFSANRYLAELQSFYCSSIEVRSKALATAPSSGQVEAAKFAQSS